MLSVCCDKTKSTVSAVFYPREEKTTDLALYNYEAHHCQKTQNNNYTTPSFTLSAAGKENKLIETTSLIIPKFAR
jgi:hypothetical protein